MAILTAFTTAAMSDACPVETFCKAVSALSLSTSHVTFKKQLQPAAKSAVTRLGWRSDAKSQLVALVKQHFNKEHGGKAPGKSEVCPELKTQILEMHPQVRKASLRARHVIVSAATRRKPRVGVPHLSASSWSVMMGASAHCRGCRGSVHRLGGRRSDACPL